MGLISIDGPSFNASMSQLQDKLGWFSSHVTEAVAQAMVEFAQYALSLVQAAAPRGKRQHVGIRLADDGFVVGPTINGDLISVTLEWHLSYARIEDTGGFITPKDFRAVVTSTGGLRGKGGRFISKGRTGAARLFIPLREGVHPIQDSAARKAMGYKYGVDYVFAQVVEIKGSGYITRTLFGGSTSAGLATESGAGVDVRSGGVMGNAPRDILRGAEKILEARVNDE